jgi:hypothetical protein
MGQDEKGMIVDAMLVVFAGGIGIAIYCVMLRGRGRWF